MLNPALTELVAVATDDGAPVDDGSPKGAVLALTAANSTPGECLSVARYRFLHHTAVSFVSSDITGRSRSEFDPISDWDGGDEVTVANVLLPDVVDFNPTSGARKRKGRSTQNHAARDARRKRQHVAALLLTTQGNTKAGT